jgi:hypothetical protein
MYIAIGGGSLVISGLFWLPAVLLIAGVAKGFVWLVLAVIALGFSVVPYPSLLGGSAIVVNVLLFLFAGILAFLYFISRKRSLEVAL